MTRLIPPILAALLLLALWALGTLVAPGQTIRSGAQLPWDVPLILGLALLIWARLHFSRHRAEIHTFKAPQDLVTDGPFRFSRNPMYLAFTLLVLAGALGVNSWWALIAPLLFWLAAALWYIPHEERVLKALFGADYDTYAKRVRRWI